MLAAMRMGLFVRLHDLVEGIGVSVHVGHG
jgi:hypothetical protein